MSSYDNGLIQHKQTVLSAQSDNFMDMESFDDYWSIHRKFKTRLITHSKSLFMRLYKVGRGTSISKLSLVYTYFKIEEL